MSRGEFRTRRGGWHSRRTRAKTETTVDCFICFDEIVSNEKYAFDMPCCAKFLHLKCWETLDTVKNESEHNASCPMCRTRWKGDYEETCILCFLPLTSQMEWWPRCAPDERQRFKHKENRNGNHYTCPFAMSRGEFQTRRVPHSRRTRAKTETTVDCFICFDEIVSNEKYAFDMPCCAKFLHLKCWETLDTVKNESEHNASCPMCRTRWKGDYEETCILCFLPLTSQMEWWP
ncbi:---NA---, partial [Paramuricea clavata]